MDIFNFQEVLFLSEEVPSFHQISLVFCIESYIYLMNEILKENSVEILEEYLFVSKKKMRENKCIWFYDIKYLNTKIIIISSSHSIFLFKFPLLLFISFWKLSINLIFLQKISCVVQFYDFRCDFNFRMKSQSLALSCFELFNLSCFEISNRTVSKLIIVQFSPARN